MAKRTRKTFFQAIDDKEARVFGRTFEQWLDAAISLFKENMGAEKYRYELLHAFYPPGGPDDIVPAWEGGLEPGGYAMQRYRAARPPKDQL